MRKSMVWLLIPLLFISGKNVGAADNDVIPVSSHHPIQPGEQLKYKVQYNLYFNVSVGKVTFNVQDKPISKSSSGCHRILAKGRTLGFYDNFYKIRDHYETCLNMRTMKPSYFMKDIYEGGYEDEEQVEFNHSQRYARTTKGDMYRIKEQTQDLLSVLYYARTLDYESAEPGDSATFTTFISDSTYEVGVKYMGKTKIDTKLGTFKCLKLKPLLVVGRLFDSKYDMTLWVSADRNKVPLRVKSGISVGRIKAQLTNYENLRYSLKGKQ